MFRRCRIRSISGMIELLMLIPLITLQAINRPITYANHSINHAATSITVDPSQRYQTIQGWGTSLAWWANIIGGWSDSQRMPLAQALYSPTQGIGLNVLRYNFGADGPDNQCHNQMRPGGNVPSFEPTKGQFVWTNDANQLWFTRQAQSYGADIFQGFVNSAPAWILNNSCTAGGSNGAENLNSAHNDDFAQYLATIAKHFHDDFHITLQTVEPFNEPTGTAWSSTGKQEGMVVSRSTQNSIIPLLASALQQNGASTYTGIASPDDCRVDESNNDYQSYSSSTKAAIVQYATHTYSGSDADRAHAYYSFGQTDHKQIWMSEWGAESQKSPIAAALALSQEILRDEHNLHPTAWVAWQAINSSPETPNTVWGLASLTSINTIIYPPRYYAMGNYSKYVREGSQMIGNSDPNSFTTYDASTGTLVIITTNNSSSSADVSYDLSHFASVGGSVTPHQTTATKNLEQLPTISIANQKFSTTLPSESITTFVIPNVGL